MSLPTYPAYKDSDVAWLGEVPEYWELKRLKHCFRLLTEKTNRRENPVALENVESWSGRFIKTETAYEGDGVAFERGDILFGKLRPYLAKAYLTEDKGEAIGDFHVLRPKEATYSRFSQYQILNREFIDVVDGSTFGAKMPRVSWDFLGNIILTVPPFSEQQTIANFLDREIAKIDELIAEQQRFIELLKEKRQAVISHAVTKGLNPDAPMKDSGIEWLGEVPVHWIVGPVKYFFTILDGCRIPLSSEERSYKQGNFPYYGASGIIDSIDDYIFDEDLVLVSEDGANLINRATPIAFVARGRYWVNNHAHILKPVDKYLDYWAQRIEAVDLVPFITGSAQPKLTIEALTNLVIAVPPSENERGQIEQFVVMQNMLSNNLIAEAQRAIELLKERRTTLISAAVTGKIDVRGLVADKRAV